MTDASAYPQSRNEAFGQGSGSAPVSPLQVEQVDPSFRPSGVLGMTENIPSGIGQDPRVTGMTNTKQYGITKSGPPAVSGSNQGSSPMNV
jgi:hypothetical protein